MKHYLYQLDPNSNTSLCVISIIGTVALSAIMLLPILVGSYIDYLGFDEDTSGWISAINLAGTAFITLVLSFKIKHWNLMKIAGFGMLVLIISDFLTLYFHTLEIFTSLRFISGLGGGAAQAAVAAAIARLTHSEKGYGIYIAFQFLVSAAGLYFFPTLLPDIGFNGMFKILIAVEVISLLMIPVLNNYKAPEQVVSSDAGIQAYKLIVQKPALLSLLGLCIYGAANASIWAYADRIGIHSGLSNEGTGLVLSVSSVLAIAGALLVIWLKDTLGYIRPLIIGITTQVIAMFILLADVSARGFALGIVIYSVAWAFSWPYFLSNQAKLDKTGTVVVAGQFSNLVGNAMGPALAALFVSSSKDYNAIILLTSVLFVFSLLSMLGIYKRGKQ